MKCHLAETGFQRSFNNSTIVQACTKTGHLVHCDRRIRIAGAASSKPTRAMVPRSRLACPAPDTTARSGDRGFGADGMAKRKSIRVSKWNALLYVRGCARNTREQEIDAETT